MFEIDLTSKRARLALRFFSYGVMTVTTVVLTVLLIFLALGYRFDRTNLTFLQGGLVQFVSTPQNTDVIIDGKKQTTRTPTKANLPAGRHTIEMSQDGYRPWNKTIDVAPGQLLWLNYARLMPNSIVTSNVREFDNLSAAMPSPDRHFLLLQKVSNQPDFVSADVANEKTPTFTDFRLPDTALTKKDDKLGTFEIVEWDLGSRYVLIKHQNGDLTEFIRADRSKPAEAVNLTRLFGLAISEVHFSGGNANIVFAKTADVLRRLDIGNSSASAALVTGLKHFTVYGEDSIAFTGDQEKTPGDGTTKEQIVGLYRHNKITVVRTVPVEQEVLFAYSEYFNHSYLALGNTASSTVEIIRDPSIASSKDTDVFARLVAGVPLKQLGFSSNGRFLTAQRDNNLATYDLEEAKSYNVTLDFGAPITTPLRWLDDFYLWSDSGGKLRIVEFDGHNDREITTLTPGFGVLLSNNGHQLFSIAKSNITGKPALQSSKLVND